MSTNSNLLSPIGFKHNSQSKRDKNLLRIKKTKNTYDLVNASVRGIIQCRIKYDAQVQKLAAAPITKIIKIVILKTNASFKNDTKSQISQQNDVKL